MEYDYSIWLMSDKGGREIIMRYLFEHMRNQDEKIAELERRIGRMEVEKNPLKRLSHSLSIISDFEKSLGIGNQLK